MLQANHTNGRRGRNQPDQGNQPPVRTESPTLSVPQPDPTQMQAQLNALTDLVRGSVATIERMDGKKVPCPLLKIPPSPPPKTTARHC
ncbi:hypothetical protein L484_005833 [Morus notabilis]|uniref:Uncharacterized protein n=1 Tax=Morus notabilis TaxID=981085 RepID=W9QFJ8_9ROSA|nr:hypothetical protein L484_005833 [Morus notabilis]